MAGDSITTDSSDIPKAGDLITIENIEEISQAIKKRQENFPEESMDLTMTLVMLNIGDRYAPVSCIVGEWTGLKRDIPKGEGVPKCPNGHVLTQGPGLRLGWYEDK